MPRASEREDGAHGWMTAAVAAFLGVALGAGALTFAYADGAAYLTDDPAACASCHVMGGHFVAWERSAHRSGAACNDCHAPRDGFAAKYAVKALNGLRHGWAFTTGRYDDALRITPLNRRVSEASCRGCHARMVEAVDGAHSADGEISCIRCHGAVGHPL
jgi:cytochrome c nitrite reductase small subunit